MTLFFKIYIFIYIKGITIASLTLKEKILDKINFYENAIILS